MNRMALYQLLIVGGAEHHQAMFVDDHGDVPRATCPCGAPVEAATRIAQGTTTEYKSRCLTTSKNYTDDRKAPGS